MSDKGVKRRLSDEHEQSSPECLLPVQPLTDSDNENSPECLFPAQPVTDGYASDEMEMRGPKYILKPHNNASDIPPTLLHGLTYLEFEDMKPEINLKESSVVECLFHAFKFTFNVDKDEDVKVKGQTMEERYEYWKSKKQFIWVNENDKSNFHELSLEDYHKEIKKIKDFIKQSDMNLLELEESVDFHLTHLPRHYYAEFMEAVADVFEDVYHRTDERRQSDESYQDGDTRRRLLKLCVSRAAQYLPGITYAFLRSGEIRREFPLVLQGGDNNLSEGRCVITVEPDGVFTARARDQKYGHCGQSHGKPYVWKLLLQPSADTLTLHRPQHGCEWTAQQVQRLFYVDYHPRDEEIRLKTASVEECLLQAFQFTSLLQPTQSDEKQKHEELKIKGRTMTEICACSKKVAGFSWILENDDKNLLDFTQEQYKKQVHFFSKHSQLKQLKDFAEQTIYGYASFVKNLCFLLEDLYKSNEQSENNHGTREVLEEDFMCEKSAARRIGLTEAYLEGLVVALPCWSYRRGSQCESTFHLAVDPDLNKRPSREAVVEVKVKPCGVFVGAARGDSELKEVWRLVVEVCKPCGCSRQKPTQHITPDKVFAEQCITASVPPQCVPYLDQIAGRHVLQLFTSAQETILNNDAENLVWNGINKCAKAVGLFIVNQFVYFSKLVVEERTLMYLNIGKTSLYTQHLPKCLIGEKKRPKVSYGNFRFDLTIANHRKAFILFLNHFLMESEN